MHRVCDDTSTAISCRHKHSPILTQTIPTTVNWHKNTRSPSARAHHMSICVEAYDVCPPNSPFPRWLEAHDHCPICRTDVSRPAPSLPAPQGVEDVAQRQRQNELLYRMYRLHQLYPEYV